MKSIGDCEILAQVQCQRRTREGSPQQEAGKPLHLLHLPTERAIRIYIPMLLMEVKRMEEVFKEKYEEINGNTRVLSRSNYTLRV